MKLYLIGLPGSGKSFLGRKLADESGLPFIDLDEIIEKLEGRTVAEIFSEGGEEYFRKIEAAVLRQQNKTSGFVMSCGGGTPCFHDNMQFIKESGTSIFLNTAIEKIVERLNSSKKDQRPLLIPDHNETLETKLNSLLQKRLPFYQLADIIIEEPNADTAFILKQVQIKK